MLDQLEDTLDGVELRDDGADQEAAQRLRRCADLMEAALREKAPGS